MIKSEKGTVDLKGSPLDIVTDLHVAIVTIAEVLQEVGLPKERARKMLDESISEALKVIEESEDKQCN